MRKRVPYQPLGLVAAGRRQIGTGERYAKYFTAPEGRESYLSYVGSNFDTIAYMREIVAKTLSHTKRIAPVLKGSTLEQTTKNIFDFVYQNYQYKQDSKSAEELRSPFRAWADRKSGVDCDCYTITISSILTNLGIDHAFKMTKYDGKAHYQHIYVVVPKNQSNSSAADFSQRDKYYVIDPVLNKPDYEKPPSDAHIEIIKVSQMQVNGLGSVEEPEAELLTAETLLGLDGRRSRRRRRRARRTARKMRRSSRRTARRSRRSARRTARSMRRSTRRATRGMSRSARRRAMRAVRKRGRALKRSARRSGRSLKRTTRRSTRSLKRNVRRGMSVSAARSLAAKRIAAARQRAKKRVAARRAALLAAKRRALASRSKRIAASRKPTRSASQTAKRSVVASNRRSAASVNNAAASRRAAARRRAAERRRLRAIKQQNQATDRRVRSLEQRLAALRKRNAILKRKQKSTRRIAVSNQQQLNQILAERRAKEIKNTGDIKQVRSFGPKEASVKPLTPQAITVKAV